jgi:putative transcriptional regulator
MKKKRTAARKIADWRLSLDAMSEEEAHKAALADPDAKPLSKRGLANLRRVSPVKRLRWKLGLSQSEFAERYGIPIGTLRDWEQHRHEPDQTALTYLKVIEDDPKRIARVVAA